MVIICCLFLLAATTLYSQESGFKVVDIVDPTIGTKSGGETKEGASFPFGLVNASPYRDPTMYQDIKGLTTMELSGTGCSSGGLGTLTVRAQTVQPVEPWNEWTTMLWGSERAHPYSYEYELESARVRHEATATGKVALHRFFCTDKVGSVYIVLNAGASYVPLRASTLDYQGDQQWSASIETQGFCGQGISQVMHAWIEVRSPYTEVTPWSNGTAKGVVLTPSTFSVGDTFELRIGVSFVSVENARMNLIEETAPYTFNEVRELSRQAWQELLGRVDVRGGTRADSVMFYTALYRSFQYPAVYSDVNGEYLDMNGHMRTDTDHRRRTFYDLWGCVWTTYPLQSLLAPEHAHDVASTMLGHARETGYLTNWEYLGDEVFMMGGDPQPHLILDFWQRGIIKHNLDEYYDVLSVTARAQSKTRHRQDLYAHHGYVPSHDSTGTLIPSNVTLTLEYAMSDLTLAHIAEAVGDIASRDVLLAQSARYRNVYDSQTGFFRPRTLDGSWSEPFDPTAKEGNQWWEYGGGPGFTEGSAWHYLFFPYHDVRGAAILMGGEPRYVQRLDEFFAHEKFRLDNQPLFTQPWLYTYIRGAEWKSHARVREVLASNFSVKRDGIPGNDDLGSTSSWAAWSMLGLYPILDGKAQYRIGRPAFTDVTLQTETPAGQPHRVQIVRIGDGAYVNKVIVDGVANELGALKYSALHAASRIELHCSDEHPDESSIENTSGVRAHTPAYNVHIAPNPADEVLSIGVDDGLQWFITIFDAFGQAVASTSTHTYAWVHVDVSNLAPGAYFVCGRQDDKSFIRKVLVQR